MYKIVRDNRYLERNISDYSALELYTLTYLITYISACSVMVPTGLLYRGTWSQFDETALMIFICGLSFYYMQVSRLPFKFAIRRAQDLELDRQVSLNEAKKFVIRYISHEVLKIRNNSHTIIYNSTLCSHEIRTPIMIAECNMAMTMDDLAEGRRPEDTLVRLQEGMVACRTALVLPYRRNY